MDGHSRTTQTTRPPKIDWGYVGKWGSTGAMISLCAIGAIAVSRFFFTPTTANLWIDAHIYYRATEAWLAGSNPWLTSWSEIPFAAPPPALLLNLPLQVLGESGAVVFWVVANTLSIAYLLWRFRLPVWYVLFLPIAEGWLGATPDLTIAALVLLGGGWLAGLVKPYSIPAILAAKRWRALLGAVLLGVITIPILPWAEFFASRELVSIAFRDYTLTVSAFGEPVLMALTGLALLSLGWRRGLGLTTPELLAQQPHYSLFSLEYIGTAPLLVMAMTLPIEHLAAWGIIGHALWQRVGKRRTQLEPPDQPAAATSDGRTTRAPSS